MMMVAGSGVVCGVSGMTSGGGIGITPPLFGMTGPGLLLGMIGPGGAGMLSGGTTIGHGTNPTADAVEVVVNQIKTAQKAAQASLPIDLYLPAGGIFSTPWPFRGS
jgi:hypothetical protein